MIDFALLVTIAVLVVGGLGRMRLLRLTALTQRRSTIRALRRFRTFVEPAPEPDAVLAGTETSARSDVEQALVDLLDLDDCYFEADPGGDLPTIDAEGNVTGVIHRWVEDGLVLPSALSIPAGPGSRYVLVGRPGHGTTVEQRLLALAVVAVSRRTEVSEREVRRATRPRPATPGRSRPPLRPWNQASS